MKKGFVKSLLALTLTVTMLAGEVVVASAAELDGTGISEETAAENAESVLIADEDAVSDEEAVTEEVAPAEATEDTEDTTGTTEDAAEDAALLPEVMPEDAEDIQEPVAEDKTVALEETTEPVTVKETILKKEAAPSQVNATVKIDEISDYSYGTPCVYLEGSVSGAEDSGYVKIYRSKKQDSGYAQIGQTYAFSYFSYYDQTVEPGTTYYYKVQFCDYEGTVTSAFSNVKKMKVVKPSADVYAFYEDGKVRLSMESSIATRYDVYRSTKKSKGYKKIATVAAAGGDAGYVDGSVKNNTAYYYKVMPYYYNRSAKKDYKGTYSDPAKVKTLLGYIANFEAKQTSATKVKLSWDKLSGANSYEIYLREDISGDAYRKVSSTKKTSATVTIPKDTNVWIQLRAYRIENGNKKYDASATEYVSNDSLSAPAHCRVTSVSMKKSGAAYTVTAKVKWDKVYNAKGYELKYISNGKVCTKKISKNSTTGATLTIKKSASDQYSVNDGNDYYYKDYVYVMAVKGKEKSYRSSATLCLNGVQNVKAGKQDAVSAKISWKKVSGATYYSVYRRAAGDRYGYGVMVGSTEKTSYIDKDITPGIQYEYYVIASNRDLYLYSHRNFDPQDRYNAKTKTAAYTHKLTAPSVKSVSNTAKKTMTVTINASKWQNDVVEYTVYRSTSKKGAYKKVGTVKAGKINKDGKTLTFTDKKAAKGKTYYYKVSVKVKNEAGISVTSGQSGQKSAKSKK